MKLAIIGSRNFADKELLFSTVDKIRDKVELIISGGAVGADSLAQEYAKERGLPILVVYPNWRPDGKFDKGAGFRRNIEIVKLSSHVLAFWDKKSHGTEHSISVAEREGKPVKIIEFKDSLDGYYFVSGKEHPLSLDEETAFEVGTRRWQSLRQAFVYYYAILTKNSIASKVLSLDLSKKNYFKKLEKFQEELGEFDAKITEKVINTLVLNKFSTTELKDFLSATDGQIIYADDDRILGIGMKKDHPDIHNFNSWGLNLFGNSLTKIRNDIKEALSVKN